MQTAAGRTARPGARAREGTDPAARPDGTQAIRRVAGLLRAIAETGAHGAALADIARHEGLPRSTVHRMLRCLVDEALVELVEGKRYQVGPLVHELSLAATSSAAEVSTWRPVVEAVARRTGVTAYLMRRSGVEAVCVVKVDGHSRIRFVPVEVGQRRPLGVGAGATALLAALEAGQVESVIRAIAPRLAGYARISPASLREAVRLTRRGGYAISQGTVADDGFGMGIIVPDACAVPHLAVSIAAHASMVTESSIANWKKVLAEEVRAGSGA